MRRYYSETEIVASIEGLTVTQLRAFVDRRCVVPASRAGETTFDEADAARIRLLSELSADFEIDEDAAALVISLIDQIHGLRRELRALGAAVAEEPAEVRDRLRARLAASISP